MGCGGVFGTLPGSWGGLTLNLYKGIMLPVTKTESNILTLESATGADGASNTLMIGESLGSSYGSTRDYGFPWVSSARALPIFASRIPCRTSAGGIGPANTPV